MAKVLNELPQTLEQKNPYSSRPPLCQRLISGFLDKLSVGLERIMLEILIVVKKPLIQELCLYTFQ
jgi:hypothetical protein